MTAPLRIVVSREIDRPAEQVWAVLTDWERQGDWMPATTVRATGGAETDSGDGQGAGDPPAGGQGADGQGADGQGAAGRGVGGRIEAWTGVGRLGFLDTMVITAWDPPRRCDVMHTGRLVHGPGSFMVTALGSERCQVTWEEDLKVPFGRLGGAMAWLIRAVAQAGLGIALRRFSRYVRRNPPDGR